MEMTKPIILGLCTANRCRSQMFEAIMKHLGGDRFTVMSAGTKATFVHPLAIKVLAEMGIATTGQTSKKIHSLNNITNKLVLEDQHDQQWEYPLDAVAWVITLCGGAQETCPVFPGNVHRDHWPIDDPDQYAGDEETVLPYFRASRDDIYQRVKTFLEKYE